MTETPSKPDDSGETSAAADTPPPGGNAPATAASGSTVVTIAVAAFLGAVLSLIVLFALERGGIWPAGPAADLRGLEARVTTMERQGAAATPDGSELGQIDAAIERLRDRIASVESRPSNGGPAQGGPDLGPALNDLSARVDALSRRLPSDLESQLAGIVTTEQLAGFVTADQIADLATTAQIAAIEARVTQLETDIQHTDTRRAARALALAQLVRATRGSDSFETELAALASVRPNDARLAQLAPFAATGAATHAMLQADFDGVARRVTRAAQAVEQPAAWDRVWAWLGQAISFRRTGAMEGDDTAAIVARAEARLGEGNLPAALGEMQTLAGPARDEAAQWIAMAEARVALDRVTSAVSADILAELGG